jgi:nucleotide-binding universal stress UspA family protein
MADTTIVVPLDGSELAERALSEALTLGKALNAEVILLQVIPGADDVIREGARIISIDEQWQARKDRALQYLNGVRNRPEWGGIATRVAVEMGNPAETILDYCQQHGIDRIVMATHGRTGMSRWVFGSVAEKVLRAADRTVVLVRAGNTNTRT